VQFMHRVEDLLARAGFPVARLIPTRAGATLVQLRDLFYELFEFVPGQPFQHTVAETRESGVLLARFHQATERVSPSAAEAAPRGDYHDSAAVRVGLHAIGGRLRAHDSFSGDEAELAGLVQFLITAYDSAAHRVSAAGYGTRVMQLVHADWHPGNLLFRQLRVLAVIDYDSLRYSRRVTDVANGALQFSILAGGDPATWPEQLDEARFQAFLDGYQSVLPLSSEEHGCLAGLMCEALIAECVGPIAETGTMGRWSGLRILRMVRRKLAWLEANADRLPARDSG
jgi:homoserine kinase type II